MNKHRLTKLEKAIGGAGRRRYLCIVRADDEAQGCGYNVQPMSGGEPLHFATRQELEQFERRADVELLTIRIVRASEAQQMG